MPKILDATCVAGLVKAEGQPVEAVILSSGAKSSQGVLLMDDVKMTYVTSNASDIADLIDNVKAIVDQIKLVLTALDAGTLSPGSTTALTAAITPLEAVLSAQKENLK